MGYNTDFKGRFQLDNVLRPEHKAYLRRFSEIRHLSLNQERIQSLPDPLRTVVGLPPGTNGMYFTGMLEGDMREDHTLSPMAINDDALLRYSWASPRAEFLESERGSMNHFPSMSCQWAPTETGTEIEAVGEKFYGAVGWLRFLLEHFLVPWGYQLTGTISYQGEQGEHGKIIVENHQVTRVVESDSLLPRQPGANVDEEIHTYWMTVGAISNAARTALIEADCPVFDLHQEPPVILVGLPYDINYYKRSGHDDLAIWTTEGIALHSKRLRFWQDAYWEPDGENARHKTWQGFVRRILQLSGENTPGEESHTEHNGAMFGQDNFF